MRDGSATREKINQAALELFARKGVAETTTRDIAGGAGIAEGTIYRHYKSKDELVRSLFLSLYSEQGELLAVQIRDESGIKEQIAVMIQLFCRLFDENRPLFTFLLLTQHGQLERVPDGIVTPVGVIREAITCAQAAGQIRKGDPDLLAAMVLGVVVQPAVFSVYGRLKQPYQDFSAELVQAAWGVLGLS
ncbi:TetR/AcrR family transcriptional regulator [Kiloniella laminariae]|uniref:TetR/AcrR family transcriptional regulator n=1 Tax=Kiloniella laminariae TaxID=454162 RepID=A0ABT4LDJ3_9PROT|nr:TetR/AcrR family transcriptional regulator [Kiloniella laminariae]MCZ4279176.1 TetR/AcrR family transcriptional regulator [Kiloniella laminariae]